MLLLWIDGNLKKCICSKYCCLRCIENKKNTYCINNCYLFDNNKQYISKRYNISKYKMSKNLS